MIDFFNSRQTDSQFPLSPRETEVLNLIAIGFTLPDVAAQLGISRHTCADHVKKIYAEAALAAKRMGLIPPV